MNDINYDSDDNDIPVGLLNTNYNNNNNERSYNVTRTNLNADNPEAMYENLIPCEFCMELFPYDNINIHQVIDF
jgi:hypothetical protein